MLNPMAVNISMVRSGVQGEPLLISLQSVLIGFSIILFVFVAGLRNFSRKQSKVVKFL